MNKCIIWRWFGAVQYDCCIDCIAGSCNVVGYNKEAVHCPQHPSSRNNIHNARLLHPTVKRMRTLQHCTQAYKLQLKAFILYIIHVWCYASSSLFLRSQHNVDISTYFVSSNFPNMRQYIHRFGPLCTCAWKSVQSRNDCLYNIISQNSSSNFLKFSRSGQ